jgi:hypothetical protein
MIKEAAWAGALAVSVAGGGWGAHEYLFGTFAEKEPLQIAGAKVDFILDRQIASVAAEIGYLERKTHKTPSDLEQLRWLRHQLEQMRRVRQGK